MPLLAEVVPRLSQPYKLIGCQKGIGHVHRASKTAIVTGPPGKYHLDLRLPENILSQKSLKEQKAMFKQYGFNLKKSNEMGLVRPTRDLRNAQCQARQYPTELPKASVIIIFFNEALSTLLRNVMMVFNLTPEELLGEVLLVDDHSDLEELKLLPEHLERLTEIVPPDKVRLVHRESHDGIVAARNLGAKEARFPVIVILDSHAEVTVGWLEPLLARIHEDRKRVVVPNIVAIDIHNLDFLGGNGAWPPVRGIFNWRLTFIGAAAVSPVADGDVRPLLGFAVAFLPVPLLLLGNSWKSFLAGMSRRQDHSEIMFLVSLKGGLVFVEYLSSYENVGSATCQLEDMEQNPLGPEMKIDALWSERMSITTRVMLEAEKIPKLQRGFNTAGCKDDGKKFKLLGITIVADQQEKERERERAHSG
eukprot:s273_g15.t3